MLMGVIKTPWFPSSDEGVEGRPYHSQSLSSCHPAVDHPTCAALYLPWQTKSGLGSAVVGAVCRRLPCLWQLFEKVGDQK